MRDGWEAEAQNWARFARTPGLDHSHQEVNLPALRDLLPAPGRRTLDLGCGEGRLTTILAALGHRVVGIDAAPTMVRLAAGEPDPVPAVLADAAWLPFRGGTFDLVVAYMCLHDMDQLARVVQEAARVLDDAGRLCLAIPHPLSTAGEFAGRAADAAFVISGSYLAAAPHNMVLERGGVRLTFHSEHRPLGCYFRALEDAGLLTETIREVRAPEPEVARDPAAGRWRRIPLFLHLRAVKPG
jgi:SAM-dependent methyltransferase